MRAFIPQRPPDQFRIVPDSRLQVIVHFEYVALAKKTSVLRAAMLLLLLLLLLLFEPQRFGASKYVPEAMLCGQITVDLCPADRAAVF